MPCKYYIFERDIFDEILLSCRSPASSLNVKLLLLPRLYTNFQVGTSWSNDV